MPETVKDSSGEAGQTEDSLVELKNILEAALMVAEKPLAIENLQELFDDSERPAKNTLKTLIDTLQNECANRGVELKEVASGYRYQARQKYAQWVARLWEEKPQRYSRALLETLSLISYRQPITRGDIEEIRGVAVSSSIIRTLIERQWIRVVGHRDVPGRPSIYATTRQFLDYFNLSSLEQLPPLSEIRDLEAISREIEAQLEFSIGESVTGHLDDDGQAIEEKIS
jgi:segregation and condensation protein B